MLFDLRSRGRRRTVQVIYLGLALLMLGGLVLFGVGAGNGFGGLLNAFTNNGSSTGNSALTQQQKQALKATRLTPTDAGAWSNLILADYAAASQGSAQSTTGETVYTPAGKKFLSDATVAWQRYEQLTKSPSGNTAILAARSYAILTKYAQAADAWQVVAQANPTQAHAFECVAANAYAGKNNRLGDLAAAKAESLVPKVDRPTLKSTLAAAKTTPAIAQQC